MITRQELLKNSRAKLEDADVLFDNGRYDGAYYLCGYAVELCLKARILKHMKWQYIPEKGDKMPSGVKKDAIVNVFFRHDLEELLEFTGKHENIRQNFVSEWSIVKEWNTEVRYNSNKVSKQEVKEVIEAVKLLLPQLRK